MVVKYVAYTWQGQKVQGFLDVDQEDEAQEMLQQDNLIPYSFARMNTSFFGRGTHDANLSYAYAAAWAPVLAPSSYSKDDTLTRPD